ncbi:MULTISPECIES: 3-deoxy-7-phosphoheptulonate synthase [Caproicibacterium]|jgi:3-deoxy-7-phosphoheptulonate synthase|uniref:3-deoxy-7-phosphoheptulonate synthase n=1 Tax=Caproicibacterium lactatifermentans TaxID=2666138 RepID=A0A859DSA5_9FIRM|nr:3-deoxy-7-phosphoheptulonate synthase [Caproicibacterium lactatifermentans]ARP51200.1 3-deoxy-7-phosphoheptulonate synthase [Ruminococcaceae bacterium CPB6]MDD4807008.1 3-deoxy-7-phosphoheptulonate synthase [Oscillospiraceae bacterium]QKN24700.1 3-deoxy-7-phosphoheptulonate synthase [Caproicibacterium lactatifermentans]QKO30199.1 3-deoxy-7-phosphoheptulonate synthase [Caproicibacterium lactatifermentans]
MIILMKTGCTKKQVDHVIAYLHEKGLGANLSVGKEATVIGVLGDKTGLNKEHIEVMDGVEKCVPIMHDYKLASREMVPEGRKVKVRDVVFGGPELVMIAGPCAVESEEQITQAALGVKAAGAKMLRGGAYKPRTSPYAFQGLEDEGYRLLRHAADAVGLPCISEVVDPQDLDVAAKYCDMVQVGARNMQNFRLLREIGRSGMPVLLKNGISSTVEEWLDAAEYILSEGNPNVVLCERGIRTFETATRNTLDVSAVPVVKERSSLPIIVDPSHAAGKRSLVTPLAMAGVAAGADGIIVEVHPNPKTAMSDAAQQLTLPDFQQFTQEVRKVAEAVGRIL